MYDAKVEWNINPVQACLNKDFIPETPQHEEVAFFEEKPQENTMKASFHTFVICAYKESEYLEECIQSLVNQTLRSEIIMVTSTPNEYIEMMSKKYDIPLFVNEGEGGITQDWNFALSRVDTRFATIAHQDDIYEPSYAEKMLFQLKYLLLI